MAKIRLKFGENEVEIESKDFYVDNKSIEEVIYNLSRFVTKNQTDEQRPSAQLEVTSETLNPGYKTNYLSLLEDAEIHEPEFVSPISIDKNQIRSKIHILARDSFFEKPRTVSEVGAQIREYGWAAVPLDVSKILANMALKRELQKDLLDKRSYYSNKIIQLN